MYAPRGFQCVDDHSATPAPVGDRLYLRTKSKLFAFGNAPAR